MYIKSIIYSETHGILKVKYLCDGQSAPWKTVSKAYGIFLTKKGAKNVFAMHITVEREGLF